MAIKVLYVRKDGVVEVLDSRADEMFFRKDGYHVIPSGAIFHEKNLKDDSITVLPQGRIVADGGLQSKPVVMEILSNITLMDLVKKKLGVENSGGWMKFILAHAGRFLILFVGVGLLIALATGG